MEDLKSTPSQFLEPESSLNPVTDSSMISITLVSEEIFLSPLPSPLLTSSEKIFWVPTCPDTGLEVCLRINL